MAVLADTVCSSSADALPCLALHCYLQDYWSTALNNGFQWFSEQAQWVQNQVKVKYLRVRAVLLRTMHPCCAGFDCCAGC